MRLAGRGDNHVVLMNIRHQHVACVTAIDPEPRLLAALVFVLESLCFQQLHHLLPGRVTAGDEGLGKQQMQMGLLKIKAVKPDVVTKGVIRQ
jgi:hypothetical protein